MNRASENRNDAYECENESHKSQETLTNARARSDCRLLSENGTPREKADVSYGGRTDRCGTLVCGVNR